MAARKKAKKKAKKTKKVVAKKTRTRRPVAKKSARKVSRPKKTRKAPARSRTSPRPRPAPKQPVTDSDSQGLSKAETVDSESVGELIDEGNTFEAGVVEGVEQADNADEREVRTREFPEDDVPEEYLDKD
ncbi:MAG TPA: hypothetical protein VJQ59_06215 [Candidatus Sulfotelmatobacter sp.]|nr:hypothetical protein [Candidatus Sulfotelmatobacter sp.]